MDLTKDEKLLAAKLSDAGPTEKEAEEWVRQIVTKAYMRGVSYGRLHGIINDE